MMLKWWAQDRMDVFASIVFGAMTNTQWEHYRRERAPWTSR